MTAIEKRSLKMACFFVLSFSISSEILDAAMFYIFPDKPLRVVSFLTRTIIFPKDFTRNFIDLAIYIITMGVFVIFMAWLMRKLRPDFHLRQKALSRWVCLGITMSLGEFSELYDIAIFDLILSILLIMVYWLIFIKFPPTQDILEHDV